MDAIAADHVIPVAGPVLTPGWVGIEAGRIKEVAPGRPPRELAVVEGGPASVLMPGLVSAHTHLALGHLRHVADELPFLDWILRGIVPAIETSHATPTTFQEGARRSARELLEGGVTLVGDNFLRAEGVTALRETGQKGIFFQEVFGSLAPDEAAYIEATGRELDELGARLGGFPFGYSPHTPWTCPAKTFAWIAERARTEGRRVSCHLSESTEEFELFARRSGRLHAMLEKRGTLDRYRLGGTPVQAVLESLGPEVVVAHAVQATEEDLRLLAAREVKVVHCPTSNLKLAEGIAPVAAMIEAGITVALGVDSAASTGKLDLFEEMRLALLLQRGVRRAVFPMTAARVLEMATVAGARALGFDDTGTLEPGRAADLVLLRLDRLRHGPLHDPTAAVVYSATPDDVVMVVIDGVVRHRREGRA